MSKLKVIELFAGIGAWSKALDKINIDYEVNLAVEMDQLTIDSYNAIHKTNFKSRNIEDIQADNIPESDIIFYSPPCQTFSTVGKKQGLGDKRGLLFYEALKIIKQSKPKFAIMENVTGLVNGFKEEFAEMISSLEDAGYKSYWQILNAKDYGLPQNRKRVFVISVRNDIDITFQFPSRFNNDICLKDILFEKVDERYYIETKDWAKELLSTLELDESSPISFTRKKAKLTTVCNTLMAHPPLRSLGNNTPITGKCEIYEGKKRMRVLTPLEYWLLNGYSLDDFKLAKTQVKNKYTNKDHIDGKLYKMAGNSIAIDTVVAILHKLLL